MRKRKERRGARLARSLSEARTAQAFEELRRCKHEKRTQYGVCERCGDLQRPDPADLDEPVNQQTTTIIQLKTPKEVRRLFRKLAALRELAPRSLTLTIAVTAKRSTIVRKSKSDHRFPDATKRIDE